MEAEDPRREAARLIAGQSWLALATVDSGGAPSVSYVPFATVDGGFGIVVSRLAAHTASLSARRPAAVIFVADDGPGDAYARARFSAGVMPTPRAPGSAQADAIWAALEARQGTTARLLRTLSDFQAISLEPTGGRLVLGFASAHDIEAVTIAELLRAAG